MGARLVKDINPAGSSSPNELVSVNGLLFFSAEVSAPVSIDGNNADGQEDSEEQIDTELEAETPNSSTDTQPSGGVGLMRSDGSDNGTTILKSFDSVSNLVESGNNLYFIAGINNQYQLWTSDGTTRGTKQVKDLYPNADPNFPQDLFEIDGVLFYSAIDGERDGIDGLVEGGIGKYPYANGYEVWRREGKGVGSRFFRNLIPDKIITEFDIEEEDEELTQAVLDENGDPVLVEKLVEVIGPDGKPVMVDSDPPTYTLVDVIGPDGQPVMVDSDPVELIQVPVFVDGAPDIDPTTGTPVQEYVVKQVPKTEYVVDQVVKTELALVPATETLKTAKVTTNVFENDSFPRDFTGINGNYFFIADSSSFYSLETRQSDVLIGGQELWFSDGTEAGTQPININENVYTIFEPDDGEYTPSTIATQPEFGFVPRSSSSFPRELTPSRNKLYFVANDGIAGFELWSITDQGTKPSLIGDLNPGSRSSSPEELTIIGKNLYFSADEGNGRKLFYYNKSLNKPELVKNSGDNPESLAAVGNKLYYSAESKLGRELWSAKKSNSKMVKDINPGSDSSSPSNMIIIKRINGNESKNQNTKDLYFTADDGSHGTELMSINLRSKTKKVSINADIIDGPSSSFPRELTNHDQQLYFTAKDSSKGRELWTLGPVIKGPSGKSGASSSNINVFENKTFVYQFKTDDEGSNETEWKINGGNDASFFKINSNNGRLEFKSNQEYKNPEDFNSDNIYEVFVRSIDSGSGYKSDQLINVSVSSAKTSELKSDEILYYTADCGPMTANGPLYPCNTSGSNSGGSGSGSSNSIPTVTGSNLSSDGRQYYNEYNSNIDDYNSDGDCFAAELNRGWASLQLDYEDDSTLAKHFNKYFTTDCNVTELII